MVRDSCKGEKLCTILLACFANARNRRLCAYSMPANATTTLETSCAFMSRTFGMSTCAMSLKSSSFRTPALLYTHARVQRLRGTSNSSNFARMVGANTPERSSSSALVTRENAHERCTSSCGEQSSTRCSSTVRAALKSSPWLRFDDAKAQSNDATSARSKLSKTCNACSAIRANACSSRYSKRSKAEAAQTRSVGVRNSVILSDIARTSDPLRASASAEPCKLGAFKRQAAAALRSLGEKLLCPSRHRENNSGSQAGESCNCTTAQRVFTRPRGLSSCRRSASASRRHSNRT
mmetsp:Transcript_20062/g.39207  ORF Transcript_20062/g.39207 Transcript_20062/m.39207 type:complete len:293 (-) Transcript_20062:152-1030(-)